MAAAQGDEAEGRQGIPQALYASAQAKFCSITRRHCRALRQVRMTLFRSPSRSTKSAWVRARSVALATANEASPGPVPAHR